VNVTWRLPALDADAPSEAITAGAKMNPAHRLKIAAACREQRLPAGRSGPGAEAPGVSGDWTLVFIQLLQTLCV
jgi:hypothetical protein